MVNLWFTQKDLRYRWSEVTKVCWAEFEDQLKFPGKRLPEESLRAEQQREIGVGSCGYP